MIGVLLVLLICTSLHVQGSPDVYHISGLLPNTSVEDGRGAIIPAAELALQHIALRKDLVRPEVRIRWTETKCNMSVGVKGLFDALSEKPPKSVVLGGYCHQVTSPTAQALRGLHISQVVYADTSPLLSDVEKYKDLIRMVPSGSDFAPAVVQLIKHFGWSKVSTVFQDASSGFPMYTYIHGLIRPLLDGNNISINVALSFATDPTESIIKLKESNSRIIIGLFKEKTMMDVFCKAYKAGIYGPKYVWIVFSGLKGTWWSVVNHSECSSAEIRQAAHQSFSPEIMDVYSVDNSLLSTANITYQQYKQQYEAAYGGSASIFHGYVYDSMWAIALTFDKLLQVYGPLAAYDFNSTFFYDALNRITFDGVTGNVSFKEGSRMGYLQLVQHCGKQKRSIGRYFRGTDTLNINNSLICWAGDGVPKDQLLHVYERAVPDLAISLAVGLLSFCGIILAIGFLIVNIQYRKTRCIKMSSPNMNNLIILGCIMVYSCLYVMRVDSNLFGDTGFLALCTIRTWLLAIGFSLSFGAMFAKTWRVYSIFNNPQLQKKIIKDKLLFIIVGVLVAIDVMVLTIWTCMDSLRAARKMLPDKEFSDRIVTPVVVFCDSDNITMWMGILYVYKGGLLVGGCFLAWQTRKVSIPALNDSKYIGMSVYAVVIMCATAVGISFIIQDDPNMRFLIVGLLVILCTTTTLCLVFVPKIIQLRRPASHAASKVRVTLRQSSRDKSGGPRSNGTAPNTPISFQDRLSNKKMAVARSKSKIRMNLEEITSLLDQIITVSSGEHTKMVKLKAKCLKTATSSYRFDVAAKSILVQENQDSGCSIGREEHTPDGTRSALAVADTDSSSDSAMKEIQSVHHSVYEALSPEPPSTGGDPPNLLSNSSHDIRSEYVYPSIDHGVDATPAAPVKLDPSIIIIQPDSSNSSSPIKTGDWKFHDPTDRADSEYFSVASGSHLESDHFDDDAAADDSGDYLPNYGSFSGKQFRFSEVMLHMASLEGTDV